MSNICASVHLKPKKTLSHISHFLEQENLCKFMNLFCERSSDFWRQNQNVWLQCCKMCFSNTMSLEEKVLNIRRRSEKTFGDLIWHHIIFLGGTYLPRELTTKLHFGRSFLLIPLLVSYFHICIMRGDWTSEQQKTMHQKVCKEKSLMDRRSFLYVATTISKALLVVITFEKNFKRIAGGLASTTLNHSFWTSARFKKNLDVCPAKYCWLFSNGIAPEILFRWTTIQWLNSSALEYLIEPDVTFE